MKNGIADQVGRRQNNASTVLQGVYRMLKETRQCYARRLSKRRSGESLPWVFVLKGLDRSVVVRSIKTYHRAPYKSVFLTIASSAISRAINILSIVAEKCYKSKSIHLPGPLLFYHRNGNSLLLPCVTSLHKATTMRKVHLRRYLATVRCIQQQYWLSH